MIRALGLLALVLAAVAAVQGSQATFTGSAQNSGGSFATASDWVAPTLTLTTPSSGTFTADNTPTLGGAAGNGSGDVATVSVRIYSGSSATGSPVQTLTPTRSAATWTATAATLADGTYTAQASQTDGSGNTGASGAVTFTVDTAKPTATSIVAANKGGAGTTAGKLDSGDTITFTFSEPIDPASILSGWSGTSTAVRVRFTNLALGDSFAIRTTGPSAIATLGSVTTAGDYVSYTSDVQATMERSADGASVVVTLGTPASAQATAVGARNMIWTIGAGVKDRAGNAIGTPATRAETDSDVDF